jgi:AraC-like DNA-binding protein
MAAKQGSTPRPGYADLVVTELTTREPPPKLREYVVRCEGFAERTSGPLRRREVAYPAVPVILSFGTDWWLLDPDRPGAPGKRHRSFVAGLHDGPAMVEHGGEAHCMQLDLTPLGANAVFGVAMHELAGRCVALGDLIGERPAAELVERLVEAEGWRERFDVLEGFVAERVASAPGPTPDTVRAWRRLEETGGRLSVEALARELGCSRRHLAARFREQVGLPPKTVARVVRFHRATRLLRTDGAARWADIAHECGYFDQSHFNRDFRDLAGTSPGEFMASLLPGDVGVAADAQFPFVQDAAAAAA